MAIPSYIRLPDGAIYVNPVKRHVRPFWLVTDPVTVTVPAGGIVEAEVEIDTLGHFEWIYNQCKADGDFTIQILDVNTGRQLMNRPVHIRTISSIALSGERPFKLPESYFFNTEEAGRTVKLRFRDLSGAENNIRWVMHGRRWYHKEAPPEVQHKIQERFALKERTYVYWLTTIARDPDAIPTIPASGTLTERFSATDEADSEISKLTLVSTGPFTFQLRERASGKTLSNGQVHSTVGWGDAEFPFIWASPLLLERNYDLDLEMVDLSGAPNQVFATLTARRLQYA